MPFWERRRRERAAAERWYAGLVWFRVRYQEPAGLARCLRLLSAPEACGRLALQYEREEGAVAQLWLGVPAGFESLLQKMSATFGFRIAIRNKNSSLHRVPPIFVRRYTLRAVSQARTRFRFSTYSPYSKTLSQPIGLMCSSKDKSTPAASGVPSRMTRLISFACQ